MDYGFVPIGNWWLVPFNYLTDPHSRVFLLYLLTSTVIALVIHLFSARTESPIRALVPKAVYLHRSAVVDYIYFITNSILYGVLLAPFVFFSTWISSFLFRILGGLSEPVLLAAEPNLVIVAGYTLVIAMASDFGTYLSHYLFHRIPVLWEFHKVHHSAEVLTPFTVYRMHPVDDLVTIMISGVFTGLIDALTRFFIAPGLSPFVLYGLGAVTFVFYVVGYNLRHSHIWWSFGPTLSKVFISPAQHQIHHSVARKHWDKNFGLIFALWDWMFGTLYVPVEREKITFGIGNGEDSEFSSPLRLYFLPFVKNWRRVRESFQGRDMRR